MKQFVIGLMGYAGVGKDAIAAALGFPTASFAKALKEDLAPLLRMANVNLSNREHKEKVRPLLVEYGRTMRRLEPGYWVRRIQIPKAPIVVITDLRYWNEAELVLDMGGIVVNVVRPGVGPANEEEGDSIARVISNITRERIPQYILSNRGTVAEAAASIRKWLPEQNTLEVTPKPHQMCGNVRISYASPMKMMRTCSLCGEVGSSVDRSGRCSLCRATSAPVEMSTMNFTGVEAPLKCGCPACVEARK